VKEKLFSCYQSAKSHIDFSPELGIVLGSGLGALADEIDIKETLSYSEIDGFPVSTVAGHKGRFVFGYMDGVPVVIMQGRVHYYEGYPITDTVLPVRLMKLFGIKALLLTNASGSLNREFKAGDFMLIKDHIMNFVPSPLVGANIEELGPRFPDMSEVYSKVLSECVRQAAADAEIHLREGVYVQLTGPNYETPSEVNMCRLLGGDAVGMSTAAEAVAARHAGLKVVGISCVSNLGCGISDKPLSHVEVMEAADKAAPKFKQLIRGSVAKIHSKLA
jgi:purine-nucleoside phosphorylase